MRTTWSNRTGACATRRQLLGRGVFAAGLAGAVGLGLSPGAGAASANAKLRQADIGYQPSPKGSARCELCVNWQAPAACKVVAGPISPSGWCSLFARKA